MERLKEIAELKAAFNAWTSAEHDADVKRAVAVVTGTLKAAGWPIEAIIVQLKSTARESDAIQRYERLAVKSEERPMARAVRWAIQFYYAEPGD